MTHAKAQKAEQEAAAAVKETVKSIINLRSTKQRKAWDNQFATNRKQFHRLITIFVLIRTHNNIRWRQDHNVQDEASRHRHYSLLQQGHHTLLQQGHRQLLHFLYHKADERARDLQPWSITPWQKFGAPCPPSAGACRLKAYCPILRTSRGLSDGKSSGPDGIPNSILVSVMKANSAHFSEIYEKRPKAPKKTLVYIQIR